MLSLTSGSEKWDYAIGMGKLSGGEPTPEFLALVEKEKRGEITTEDMRRILKEKYNIKDGADQ